MVEGVELRGSEAGGSVGGGRAQQGLVVEVAAAGVDDDAVDEAVEAVALAEHLGADGGEEGDGDVRGGVDGQVVRAELDGPRLQVGGPPRGRARQHAVEVGRVQLDVLEALPPARRAAGVVGVADRAAVVGRDELLAKHDAAVHRTVAPVDLLLRQVQRPADVARRGVVAGVGGDDGEAVLQAGAHVGVVDAAGEPAIAHGEEPLVPLVGEEEAERKRGGGGGCHVHEDRTKGGEVGGEGGITEVVRVSKRGVGTVWDGIQDASIRRKNRCERGRGTLVSEGFHNTKPKEMNSEVLEKPHPAEDLH